MRKVEFKKQMADVKETTVFCDKCKNKIEQSRYSGFECDLELSVGEIDGHEGFIGEKYYVDLCEPCAKDLFFKLFKENGITLNQRD